MLRARPEKVGRRGGGRARTGPPRPLGSLCSAHGWRPPASSLLSLSLCPGRLPMQTQGSHADWWQGLRGLDRQARPRLLSFSAPPPPLSLVSAPRPSSPIPAPPSWGFGGKRGRAQDSAPSLGLFPTQPNSKHPSFLRERTKTGGDITGRLRPPMTLRPAKSPCRKRHIP